MIHVVGTHRNRDLWARSHPNVEHRWISTSVGSARGLIIESDDVVEFVGIVPLHVVRDIEVARRLSSTDNA